MEVIGTPKLQAWGRMPEREPGFVSVDVQPDRLLYTFEGVSPLEAHTVVGGDGAGGYVRRVESVHTLPDGRVEAITTADYPTPASRPANSVLDCTKIGQAFGIRPRPWREALGHVVREIYESPAAPPKK